LAQDALEAKLILDLSKNIPKRNPAVKDTAKPKTLKSTGHYCWPEDLRAGLRQSAAENLPAKICQLRTLPGSKSLVSVQATLVSEATA
jgi:hypothetical protein